MAEASHNIFSMLDNADIKFPTIKNEKGGEDVEITHGNFIPFMENKIEIYEKLPLKDYMVPIRTLRILMLRL